jgi:hypothetical protein
MTTRAAPVLRRSGGAALFNTGRFGRRSDDETRSDTSNHNAPCHTHNVPSIAPQTPGALPVVDQLRRTDQR